VLGRKEGSDPPPEWWAAPPGVRWVRMNASGLILMYHRVEDLQSDPWGLAVSPRHFVEHLEVLCEHGRPLALGGAVQALQNRGLPKRAMVVTFDDGYADNLYTARPLLERYDVPATVFVTSGYTGRGREFWWDALEAILLGHEALPAELSITADGRTWRWTLRDAGHEPDAVPRSDGQGPAAAHEAPRGRYELCRAVHRVLLTLGEEERLRVLDKLKGWAGVTADAHASHRCLSPGELVALARGELIEVGSHTVSHPVLPALPAPAQREEIRQSKVELEALLRHPVTSFAYPYGLASAETASLVREEGFSCACSGRAGLLSRQTDLFCLPRIKVGPWDGEGLARVLFAWFQLGDLTDAWDPGFAHRHAAWPSSAWRPTP
jgi:peptidoglycan/xylan/chitin deacetylase (PgdA/CDA1 family)